MASYLREFRHLEIQLDEIKSATNNFDDNNVIGVGGFGKVYKGELSHPEGNIRVAFKRLNREYGQGDPEFFKELRMLSCYKHKNLISLLGYCKEGDEMILMYEHASRGSLDRSLQDVTLTWTQRIKICLDAAKGLGFLHDPYGTQQRVLHRDIKSANILLDENLNAKVSDFGLSRISPANQKYTILVTSPVGTPGYCDPLYMDAYQLTKESDVYSFGVVLFEVLCGRVCYEYSHGNFKVFVHFWKRCYEQKKLDEIIFPCLIHQLDPCSVETFVDIAYQCLQKTREQRPTMSIVVEKLEAALELKELHDLKLQREHEQEEMRKAAEFEAEQMRKAAEYEYREILKLADPPLNYKCVKELKALLSNGFPINGGKTLLSINDKGEVICERIYIEACLDSVPYDRLKDPSGYENSRFPGGRCYFNHEEQWKVHVRAQFLCPLITYSMNLVFRNDKLLMRCKTLHYKLDGVRKCCMVYNTYEREDGWFMVPLCQFTSDHKTAEFEIHFEQFRNNCMLQVAGFEFHPIEEKVELHDQWFEENQEIVKDASQSLRYNSLEELKALLSIGLYINNYKTWFSMNENGEHCEMLSIAHCLIFPEGGYNFNYNERYSRFPSWIYKTNYKGFKVHVKAQFLTPSIRYTVNIVLCKGNFINKQMYVALRYKLEEETETSIVYLATQTNDYHSSIAELYQFTSDGRVVDLEIMFEDHRGDLEVEGILFQPLEKVEHEQVLEDEKLSYDSLQWKMKEEHLCMNLLERFHIYRSQEGYAVDKNWKKSLMFSARGVISSDEMYFKSSRESRFREVAVITKNCIKIWKDIRFNTESWHTLSWDAIYAVYLVYKIPQDQSKIEAPLEIVNTAYRYIYGSGFIYLLNPPEIPFIGKRPEQITKNPFNGPKLIEVVPQRRSDGWMEVKLSQHKPRCNYYRICLKLHHPHHKGFSGLMIHGIEVRPIYISHDEESK